MLPWVRRRCSVAAAIERFVAAGGRVVVPRFDIPIGGCAVVADPRDNQLVILGNSKGGFITANSET